MTVDFRGNRERPKRLNDNIRKFAYESLRGKYGDEATKSPNVCMDEIEGFDKMTEQERYNAAIIKIAREAPLRITEFESVSGAATLGDAILHGVPASCSGVLICPSVSHLTPDFATVIHRGADYLYDKINRRLSEDLTSEQKEELLGMKNVIDAMRIWHNRYLEALRLQKPENYENLKNVPFSPARNFKEAVQSLWFTFAFTRLCGNWPGIGRIDEMLGDYLKRDMESNEITLDEAREFLAGMFIKGCEWIKSEPPVGSGDAQHYQNIILAGIDESGHEVTNEVTFLVLDIVEELAISDFPITVRINDNTPKALLRRVAEVISYGGGIVAVYNENLIIKSLVDFGYAETDARRFANDGCWEVQIPGETYFSYLPFDGLQILLYDVLRLNTESPNSFDSFEELYDSYIAALKDKVETICTESRELPRNIPSSVVSVFERGCIESGRSYMKFGPRYTVISPHLGGLADVGNSLLAIDKLVFKEKRVSFAELMQILKRNWEGSELLRQYVCNKYTYYGNDNDEADSYTVRVADDFAEIAAEADKRGGHTRHPAGISTFGRQIDWLDARCAVPFGRRKGEILAGNTSPTPNTDFEGATAVIRSYCKINHLKQTCGAALDIKLFPASVKGENGIAAIQELIKGFVRLGGFFMQVDVVDAETLKKAQKNPQEYKTLSVRVSGWNARFVTLNEEWQQMIIERTEQRI